MLPSIEPGWKKILQPYFETTDFKTLMNRIKDEYTKNTIYPPIQDIFNAFTYTPLEQVAVVILGQDPYYQQDQAHGLAFSVPDETPIPPSLKNIYKEITRDIGISKETSSGNLKSWAQQGVLLLNTVLTVEAGKPGSHAHIGWEQFTDYVIKTISEQKQHCVFLLWGTHARHKKTIIDSEKHAIFESSHPSPLSVYRGFLGNNHFTKTNTYLKQHNKKPIIW